MSERTMENGGPNAARENAGSKPGRKPWRLLMPDYRKCEQHRTCAVDRGADIDLINHEALIRETKDDSSWHCTRIPLERRMVLQLPVLSWSSGKERPKAKALSVIECEDERRVYEQAEDSPASLRTTARLIPFERRKRKRSDCGPQDESQKVSSKLSDRAPILTSMLSELPSTSRGAKESESPGKGAVSPVQQQMSGSENPDTSRETSTNCPLKDERLSTARRPESPPMRILSVRSLADDSSYFFDMLEERIPVEATNGAGDDKPPLYIFNPVRLYSDSVHGAAQNDSRLLEANKIPKETTSDMRIEINDSRKSAAETNAAESATPASQTSENVHSQEIRTAVSRSSFSNDGSSSSNAQEKVAREIKREMESRTTMPIAENTACALGGAMTSDIPVRSSSSKELSSANACSKTTNCIQGVYKVKEELTNTPCFEDVRFVLGIDPNSSPFGDSDGEPAPVCATSDAVQLNFLSNVLKELDANNSETTVDSQNLTMLDHCYSRPKGETPPLNAGEAAMDFEQAGGQSGAATEHCQSVDGLTRLVLRLPKSVNQSRSSDVLLTNLPRRRHRNNSSSSSTDTSVGVSTKSSLLKAIASREQELLSKQKRMTSELILRKMRNITQKDASPCSTGVTEHEKLAFLTELAQYFHENDFSEEPLNRSILNAMADWLSPLPNGKLPPTKVRNELVNLIKHFTLTTPAQVFQTTSIEGVLILLMNHPKESHRNKKLEWCIVSSWRDD